MWVTYILISIPTSLLCCSQIILLFRGELGRPSAKLSIFLSICSLLWIGAAALCGIQYGAAWGVTLFTFSACGAFALLLLSEDRPKPLGSGWQEFVAAAKARVPYAERHENERRDRESESTGERHIRITLDASRTDPRITVNIDVSYHLYFAIRDAGWVCERISYAYGLGEPVHYSFSAQSFSELHLYREVFEELFVTDT
jgi:hypothetical protein